MTKARTNADNVAGDISGVTAGTGLTGGGTSGTVTLTNDMATTIAAAGDLIYGTGNDAYTRLALGTASQYLAVNSGATAPEWVTLNAGGMTLISTTSLSGSNKVGLTSIPSTYTNLQLIIDRPTTASGSNWRLRIYPNDTTAAICSEATAYANNTVDNNNGSDHFGEGSIYAQTATKITLAYNFLQYANTSAYKPVQFFGTRGLNSSGTVNDTDPFVLFGAGFMYSTTAISSLYLYTSNGVNFSGGTAYLYGVK